MGQDSAVGIVTTLRPESWGGGEEEPGVGNFILLQKV